MGNCFCLFATHRQIENDMFVSVPHPPAISCQVMSVPSYRDRFFMTLFENVFKKKSNFTVYTECQCFPCCFLMLRISLKCTDLFQIFFLK